MSNSNNSELATVSHLPTWSIAVALLTVCITGCFLNLLSLIIFTRRSFRGISINLLLASLSLSNACWLFLAIPTLTLSPFVLVCRSFTLLVIHTTCVVYLHPVLSMFHSFSVWILIAITTERWLAVCRPLQARVYCTRKHALTAITLTSLLAVAANTVRFWDFSLNEYLMPEPRLVSSYWYQLWYCTVFQTVSIYIVPVSAVTYLTVLMICGLSRSSRDRERLSGAARRLQHRNARTAKMLLFVICSFIMSYSLSMLGSVLQLFLKSSFSPLLTDFDNLLVISNSSIQFIFFYKYSQRFSSALHNLCLCCFSCAGVPVPEVSHSLATTPSESRLGRISVQVSATPSCAELRSRSLTPPEAKISTSEIQLTLSVEYSAKLSTSCSESAL